MNRVVGVARMQLVNTQTFVWVPLVVLGAAIVLSFAIFAVIPVDANMYGGGGLAPLWYFLAIGVQSLTMTFPFSQALSVSRRSFFFGTSLTAIGAGALMALLFVLLAWLETLTGGFWVNGYSFALPWFISQGPLVTWLVTFLLTVAFFFAGFASATVLKRWGATRLTIVLIALAALVVVTVAIVSVTDSWGLVGAWLADSTPLGLSGVLLILNAVLGLGAYFTLRRATP